MALPTTDKHERLIKLLDKAEPKIRDALIVAISDARNTFTLIEIETLIEAGQFQRAVDQAIAGGIIMLADTVTGTYILAGQDTARFLSDKLDVIIGFDQTNDRAVRMMRNERLRLIREFSEEQRKATRAAMVDGIERGLNPREQARNFRSSIGLTEKQQLAVQNYRRLLQEGNSEVLTRQLRDKRFDRTVRRAIREGKPLTDAQINRMVDRYNDRYIKFRAETIGRTEALRAVHSANDEAYQQAIDEGHLTSEQLKREWVTAADKRVRESHQAMDSQEVKGKETPFISGNGNELLYPGDPSAPPDETVQCRCSISTRIAKI